MKPTAIHQFHSGSAAGDAVTNSLFFTQSLLRSMGFQSEIYIEHIAPELADRLRSFREYTGSPDQVLLVHHSMGHDQLDWILGLSDRKVLVYHNITPPSFFPAGSHIQRYAQKGYDMLEPLRNAVSGSIAVSEENAEELRRRAYNSPAVIPILLDQERLAESPWNDALVQEHSRIPTILFVGRFAPNKGQVDLVEVAGELKRTGCQFQLVLVGGYNREEPSFQRVEQRIQELGLAGTVILTGKVSDEDLRAWYRASTVYCSMSEHEGFGVPFLEAMTFDLPIVAFESSAIPQVLGESALMFRRKDPRSIAALLSELLGNRALRRKQLEAQRERLRAFTKEQIARSLASSLCAFGIDCPEPSETGGKRVRPYNGPKFQIEGPAESSYSLALVNRHYAMALDHLYPGHVGVWITEGPGDYEPKRSHLEKFPKLQSLVSASTKASQPDVLVRNLWPPRVADADGLINLAQFAWEESAVPVSIIEEFNRHLDGVLVPSHFCREALINSGLVLPICVAGHGVEHSDTAEPKQPAPLQLPAGFRFLHVSSAFPRKGVDVLLQVWPAVAAAIPHAILVLKTFPNPHNTIAESLERMRLTAPAAAARITWLDEELAPESITWLYKNCHALVCPTRGEGYGLPMAEAMRHNLPVVTTDRGGHTDFCSHETAWLVESRTLPSGSHLAPPHSTWFEPIASSLEEQMLAVATCAPQTRKSRVEKAAAIIAHHTWSAVAHRASAFAETLRTRAVFPERKSAVFVTTWNERCGIATYSAYLVEQLRKTHDWHIRVFASESSHTLRPDDQAVERLWPVDYNPGNNLARLQEAILQARPTAALIQFNFGFFSLLRLGQTLERLHQAGIRTVLTLHSTADVEKPDFRASLRTIKTQLATCHRILVHSRIDLTRLESWGMAKNVSLFPHGLADFRQTEAERSAQRERLGFAQDDIVLATFGFCLPHKGLRETIRALARIRVRRPNAKLLMLNALHSDPASANEAEACRLLLSELGLQGAVTLRTEFLPDDECLRLLGATDAAVFAYQNTNESASGAVRLALAASPAVVCTPLEIFDDVRSVVTMATGFDPEAIADAVENALSDSAGNRAGLQRYRSETKWGTCATRLAAILGCEG